MFVRWASLSSLPASRLISPIGLSEREEYLLSNCCFGTFGGGTSAKKIDLFKLYFLLLVVGFCPPLVSSSDILASLFNETPLAVFCW